MAVCIVHRCAPEIVEKRSRNLIGSNDIFVQCDGWDVIVNEIPVHTIYIASNCYTANKHICVPMIIQAVATTVRTNGRKTYTINEKSPIARLIPIEKSINRNWKVERITAKTKEKENKNNFNRSKH